MTGMKKLVYPLAVALGLLLLAATDLITWTSFAWGGGVVALVAILLAVIEGAKQRHSSM